MAARALGRLGSKRAWVVRERGRARRGQPLRADARQRARRGGEVRELVVTPEDFGVQRIAPRSAIAGGDAAEQRAGDREHPRGRGVTRRATRSSSTRPRRSSWRRARALDAAAERARRAIARGAAPRHLRALEERGRAQPRAPSRCPSDDERARGHRRDEASARSQRSARDGPARRPRARATRRGRGAAPRARRARCASSPR